MKKFISTIFLIVSFTVCVLVVENFAQTKVSKNSVSTKTNPKPVKKCSEREIASFNEIWLYLEKVKQFKDVEIRSKTIADLSWLLWRCDEQNARQSFLTLFQFLTSDTENLKNKQKNLVTNSPQESQNINLAINLNKFLQKYIISKVQNLDKSFALQLSNKLTNEDLAYADFISAQNLTEIETLNPQQLSLLRKVLRNSPTQMVVPFLLDLKRKNPQIADDLFLELIGIVQTGSKDSVKNLMELGGYLYYSQLSINMGGSNSPAIFVYLPIRNSLSVIDLTSKREDVTTRLTVPFLSLVTKVLLKPASTLPEKTQRYVLGRIMLFYISADAPALIGIMMQALELHSENVPEIYKTENFYSTFRKINTSDEPDVYEKNLEELERKIGSDERDDLAVGVIQGLYNKGQFERIEKVAEYISDIEKRDLLLSISRFAQANKLINEKKPVADTVFSIWNKITDPTQKTLLAIRIIQISQKDKNFPVPSEFVYQVTRDARKADDIFSPLFLFTLAELYDKKDLGPASELVNEAVKKLNATEEWKYPTWKIRIETKTTGKSLDFRIPRIQGLKLSESLNFIEPNSQNNLLPNVLEIKNELLQSELLLMFSKKLTDKKSEK